MENLVPLDCLVPRGLEHALTKRAEVSGLPVDQLVQNALAQYLGTPLHTLFQVSTSGSLVAGVYDGAVSVGALLRHGDFGLEAVS